MHEDDLDLDSMLEEFENEWEDNSDSDEVDLDTEVEGEEVGEPDADEIEESEDEEVDEPNPNDEDEHRRNQAFRELRQQAEENKKYADFIQRLAQDSGVSPEEILTRYQERQMEEQAERQGVPVEHLKKLNDTESRLAQLEEQLFAERFNAQVDSVVAKYGNDENLIKNTFEYMHQAGIDPKTQQIDFEKLYRAANLDSIIEKEVAKARQTDLENKKKRQDSASIGNGTSVSPSTGDVSDEFVDEMLKKFDIKI
jgi:hypothetical protein